MSLEKIVIDNIKRIRKEKKISQERLAEYCNTSASYIGLMETYKNVPKLSTIERIANALNVPVIELFSESGESVPENNKKTILRNRIKNEIMHELENRLDDILQII